MGVFSYKSKEWKALRMLALRRDGFRCIKCKRSVAGKGLARVDHIETVQDRPDLSLTLSNLRTLCTVCDAARHAEKGGRAVPRVPIGLDGFPK